MPACNTCRRANITTPKTIQNTIREAAAHFAQAGIETSRLDAEVLLRHVLRLDRTELFLRYHQALEAADAVAFAALVQRRLAGEPVAYLTGVREFMALPFRVAPGVLIPRPDTEPLVEWALEWLGAHPSGSVADIGTGSGAIAVSLAAHVDSRFSGRIIAIDTSAAALAIARENAAALLPANRYAMLEFRQGSLTEPLTEPVDLLLANLPYLTPQQISGNPELAAEPRLALDGGPDGLDLIRAVIADLPRVLAPGGAAGFEIDPSQATTVASLLQRRVPEGATAIVPDLAQLPRHVVLTRAPST